jgi:hypothetical protein
VCSAPEVRLIGLVACLRWSGPAERGHRAFVGFLLFARSFVLWWACECVAVACAANTAIPALLIGPGEPPLASGALSTGRRGEEAHKEKKISQAEGLPCRIALELRRSAVGKMAQAGPSTALDYRLKLAVVERLAQHGVEIPRWTKLEKRVSCCWWGHLPGGGLRVCAGC